MHPERRYVTDTSEFQEIQERTRTILRKSQERAKESPRSSLLDGQAQGCADVGVPVPLPADGTENAGKFLTIREAMR